MRAANDNCTRHGTDDFLVRRRRKGEQLTFAREVFFPLNGEVYYLTKGLLMGAPPSY
jgi:hypothetical protein